MPGAINDPGSFCLLWASPFCGQQNGWWRQSWAAQVTGRAFPVNLDTQTHCSDCNYLDCRKPFLCPWQEVNNKGCNLFRVYVLTAFPGLSLFPRCAFPCSLAAGPPLLLSSGFFALPWNSDHSCTLLFVPLQVISYSCHDLTAVP